jgi:hypothetical protein
MRCRHAVAGCVQAHQGAKEQATNQVCLKSGAKYCN